MEPDKPVLTYRKVLVYQDYPDRDGVRKFYAVLRGHQLSKGSPKIDNWADMELLVGDNIQSVKSQVDAKLG